MNIVLKESIAYALLFFIAILTFFWPIPKTIAVRHVSLGLSILTFIILVFGEKQYIKNIVYGCYKKLKISINILLIMTAWFYFVAIFVSPETEWSLKELNGQWLLSIICFGFGLTLFSLESSLLKKIFLIFFISLALHILYIDLAAVKGFVTNNGIFPLRLEGLTEGCDKANYITNWALAFVCVDIYFRITKHTKVLPIDNPLIIITFLLVVASSYFETMRFGFIGLFFTLFGFFALYMMWGKKNSNLKTFTAITLASIILIAIFGHQSFKADDRWESLAETVPIALDTKNNQAWRGFNSGKYQIPILSDGNHVNESNYDRIAWAKEGFILITENPFGIGFGRNAFGHGLKAKYGEGGGHSHSGIIDLGIGTGFVGMGLWVAFLASLMYYGFKSFKQNESYFGMVLLFIVSGFFFRMIVDSVIRDHMLEQFMFLVGLLLALSIKEINEKNITSKV